MRWQCFETHRHRYEREYYFWRVRDLSLIFSVTIQSTLWISLTVNAWLLYKSFFFFLSSQEEIRVTVTHCLMVADGVSVRSSKPNTVQSSQLALPELRNIICSTCDGNLGRQTFQSVLVSETINVSRSRTACSFIASAKVWDHLSKRPVLV